jgi:PAS domain S-box-containing protein
MTASATSPSHRPEHDPEAQITTVSAWLPAALAWLPHDGEMAARVRAHDWAATPLGPIEGWPARLKAAVDQMLAAPQPSSIYWGPDNITLYNDSYIAFLNDAKHPSALGRPYQEVWSEVWDEYRPIIAATMAGKAHSFVDRPVPIPRQVDRPVGWFSFSWTPLRNEAGEVAGFFSTATETTERVLAEQTRDKVEAELRESERRQAFLLELADTLRPLNDAIEIQAAACRLLGEHLQVDRTYYSEIDVTRRLIIVRREHNRVGAPSMVRDYGNEFLKPPLNTMQQGRPFVSNDVRADPRLVALRPAYDVFSIGSFVRAPLIRRGELVGSLGFADVAPRTWTEAEVTLLQEVADRTWAAIERARAEAALRESEAKYRSLFQSLGTGYCVVELVFDAEGTPVDYIFLEANAAWERQTGVSADVIGKRVRSLVPDPEQFWLDTFGRIARTGQPERFEHCARRVGRWYAVDAFRIGTPEQHHVAILFDDVTARKQRELNTAVLDEIGKDLARLSSPDEIIQAVGARVGAYLDVSGCVFVDVDEAKGKVTVHHGWTSEHVPSLKQTFRLEDYLTEEFSRACRVGETFVVRDTSRDARTDPERYARLKIGAFVVIPFFWEGRWTAYLAVPSIGPRDWREDEIELLTEISNRLFSRVEHARAEMRLRASEEQQRLTIELVPAMLWWTDPAGEEATTNKRWQAYTGQEDPEIQAYGWLDAIHPDDLDATQAAFEQAFATGEPLERQHRVHQADHGYRWHLVRQVPVRDESGTIVRWFGAAVDVHELHELQVHQEVLVAELQHRTRNLLAIVDALAAETLEPGPGLVEYCDRLAALGRVQGLLSRGRDWSVSLAELLHAELHALGAASADRVRVEGPAVGLPGEVAQSMAMVLHELATNALKHGALAQPTGQLNVSWTVSAKHDGDVQQLRLFWRERGVQLPAEASTHRGYGRELIEQAIPYQLRGETRLQFTPDGVHCTVVVPLAVTARDSSSTRQDIRPP